MEKEEVINHLKKGTIMFSSLRDEFKNDKDIVLFAVNQKGISLKYASKEMQNNKEIVLNAIHSSEYALLHVSNELRNDKEVILAALRKDSYALIHASDELKNDKDLVLFSVRKNAFSLQYASKALQIDFELLSLLKLETNIVKKMSTDVQQWFYERMKVLDILESEHWMDKNIPINQSIPKSRKF